jgi:hypothetical protein
MSVNIQNYGFTKTIIKNNNKKTKNEINWIGDYDGNMANLDITINDNGEKEHIVMELSNDDINALLGIQPINMSLEDRLKNDFFDTEYSYNPKFKTMALEGALIKRKTRRHLKKRNKKRVKKTKAKIYL